MRGDATAYREAQRARYARNAGYCSDAYRKAQKRDRIEAQRSAAARQYAESHGWRSPGEAQGGAARAVDATPKGTKSKPRASAPTPSAYLARKPRGGPRPGCSWSGFVVVDGVACDVDYDAAKKRNGVKLRQWIDAEDLRKKVERTARELIGPYLAIKKSLRPELPLPPD